MKSIHDPIVVEARNRVPCRFRWENRTYRVRRLLDYWILQTRWWGREEKRIYFRLETDRGIVEIYRAAEALRPTVASSALRRHPPLPMEGDTHTRERRRTEAAYHPDVRIEKEARRKAAVSHRAASTERRLQWVLSKILD